MSRAEPADRMAADSMPADGMAADRMAADRMATEKVAAVVLAGGGSRRFGRDKLAAEIDGRTLLAHALDGLPGDARIAVIGPPRPLARRVTFLREDPPGGGPAAGLVTGLVWALDSGAGRIVSLPGDAPAAGRAAGRLLADLGPDEQAVVGVDQSGREQVLLLALRPPAARRLVELAGPDRGHDQPVRRLVAALAARSVVLPDDLAYDIDTVEQLRHFRNFGRT